MAHHAVYGYDVASIEHGTLKKVLKISLNMV